MKKFWILFSFVFLLFSCTHKITRIGYNAPENISNGDCAVKVASQEEIQLDSSYKELGKIRLGDKGFSTRCGSAEATQILKQEACALNANIIVINEAINPNIMSTCYRCSATFYKTLNRLDSNTVVQLKVAETNNISKQPSAGAQIAGYVVGFLFGYLLVSLLF